MRRVLERPLEQRGGVAGRNLLEDPEKRGGRGGALTEHAKERDQGEQPGKQRQDREVSEGGGQVGALVRC